jgi:xanthine dehydrogenase FAD-binding subunit
LLTLYDVDVETPKTLQDALIKIDNTRCRIIAGGTDVIVQMKERSISEKKLLNIYRLDELRYIRMDGESLRIGALTSLLDIAKSKDVNEFAPVLAQAADKIGSMQIINKATIGGNLGNASPSGDCIPPLYALDARIVATSVTGETEIPVKDLFTGYKLLKLKQNEMITEINFKKMDRREDGLFLKHAVRFGEACSVASVCIWLKRGERNAEISDGRIALGAVAPTVVRAYKSEEILKQGILNPDRMEATSRAVAGSISPITDVRGTADYRREIAVNLTYQALYELSARNEW